MKYCVIFTLALLFHFVAGIPIPVGNKPLLDKGKSRAITPPPDPSRPNTPTLGPEHDKTVPLPGRTGVHTDANRNIVTFYYGDDVLPEHMGHLQRNQESFPQNRNAMPLQASGDVTNRGKALKGIASAPNHPVTGAERVRDEKPPNLMNNPDHTTTTVEYLPKDESNKEGGQLRKLRLAVKNTGQDASAQLRPNPGWLPLHPDQRRGSEAPAHLNSQHLRPDYKTVRVEESVGKWKTMNVKIDDMPGLKATKAAARSSKKTDAGTSQTRPAGEGYTPKAGDMLLRHRPGVNPPPAQADKPAEQKKPKDGPSNLRPGFVSAPGHVWKPSTDGPHAGAPGHLPNAEQRFPPRPQDQAHYMKQLADKKGAINEQKPKALAVPRPVPSHLADAYAKFDAKFGPARVGDGAGRAHEAPGRIQVSAPPAAPPNHQPAPHHASLPSGPQSRNPPQSRIPRPIRVAHPHADPPTNSQPNHPAAAHHPNPPSMPHGPNPPQSRIPRLARPARFPATPRPNAQPNHPPAPHHASPPARPHSPNLPQSRPPSPAPHAKAHPSHPQAPHHASLPAKPVNKKGK